MKKDQSEVAASDLYKYPKRRNVAHAFFHTNVADLAEWSNAPR